MKPSHTTTWHSEHIKIQQHYAGTMNSWAFSSILSCWSLPWMELLNYKDLGGRNVSPTSQFKEYTFNFDNAVVCMSLDRTKTPLDLINNVPGNEYKLDSLSFKECFNWTWWMSFKLLSDNFHITPCAWVYNTSSF